MTLERPMFPPREALPARQAFATGETVQDRHSFSAPAILDPAAAAAPPPPPPKIGRRGLLSAFLALVPTAAAAGATAALPSLSAPPAPRESRRLLWLGEQLDQAEADYAAALARKAKCRTAAEFAYPEPPAEITWLPGERPPAWCGTRDETDVDGNVVYWRGNPKFRTTARQIASADQLRDFLEFDADRRTREAKEAKRLLLIAERYEADVETAIEETGYRAAYYDVYQLARRIDRVASMVYKCECRTYQGVAIKALALLIACKAGETNGVDSYLASRSRLFYATRLADDVVRLQDPARARPRAERLLKLSDMA